MLVVLRVAEMGTDLWTSPSVTPGLSGCSHGDLGRTDGLSPSRSDAPVALQPGCEQEHPQQLMKPHVLWHRNVIFGA